MSKTKQVLVGVTAVALTAGFVGCQNVAEPPATPDDPECDEWDWEADEGVYECEDRDSNYYGYYFLGGRYFSSKSSLLKSPKYKSYKSSSSFKGSKGFGSGSSFYGG